MLDQSLGTACQVTSSLKRLRTAVYASCICRLKGSLFNGNSMHPSTPGNSLQCFRFCASMAHNVRVSPQKRRLRYDSQLVNFAKL